MATAKKSVPIPPKFAAYAEKHEVFQLFEVCCHKRLWLTCTAGTDEVSHCGPAKGSTGVHRRLPEEKPHSEGYCVWPASCRQDIALPRNRHQDWGCTCQSRGVVERM